MEQETLCDPEETAPARPDGGCIYHRTCGNMTPGGVDSANQMCDSCLDECRQKDR